MHPQITGRRGRKSGASSIPAIKAQVAIATVALGVALAAAGCAKNEGATPAACLNGSRDYANALKRAPARVRLAGATPISSCLRRGQDAGELGTVGSAMVKVATDLNGVARRHPAGAATVELGYLIGAVQRGASTTSGIHTDLVRRLDSAARFSPAGALPLSFERAFGRGYAAGRNAG